MGQEVEKYIIQRILKDIDPDAIGPAGDRLLLPGDSPDALNCRYYVNESSRFVVKSIMGNTLLGGMTLPSGNNQCIGHFLYNKYNSIVFLLYNSNANHQIVQWNYDTKAFTVLIQDPALAFDPNYPITQGGILDDIFVWNNPVLAVCKINIARAKQGIYTGPLKLWQFSLLARPPIVAPTIALISDSTFAFNFVSRSTWQFAYRFVYLDGETSVFSPLSKLAYGGVDFDPTSTINNIINVTVTIPSELVPLIRTVEVAYREGNIGNYNIFNQIQYPNTTQYVMPFRNNALSLPVAVEDFTRLYDNLPLGGVEAFGLIKDRAFVTLNNEGFDVPVNFTLSAAVVTETYDSTKRYCKRGGSYNLGIVFGNDFGQTTFVKAKTSVSIPYTTTNQYIQWTLSGTPPAGFTWYQVVLSYNTAQQTYAQVNAIPYLYVSESPPNTSEGGVYDTYYIWRGHMFRKLEFSTSTITRPLGLGTVQVPQFKYLWLQIPLNTPIVPDNTYYIRFINSAPFAKAVYPIIGIVDDFLVIDILKDSSNDLIDWTANLPVAVEIFSMVNSPTEVFFETGQQYAITSGAFSVGSDKLYADTYLISAATFQSAGHGHQYTPLTLQQNAYVPPQAPYTITAAEITAESPSGIFSNSYAEVDTSVPQTVKQTDILGQTSVVTSGPVVGQGGVEKAVVTRASVGINKNIFTLDYNKISSDYGRAFIENNNERKQDQNTTVGYSDPFFQDTLTFGLNTFRADNAYSIPRDRSPITAFKKANQVLLAIHQRNTSTLYIGEGLIRQNQDFVLAKTEDVIGDNRELEFNFGCINPESITEVYGHVYWWDAYRGAVVRYTNAGLFAVSDYGLGNYMRQKAKAYEPYRNTIKIVTGYDFANEELIISFPTAGPITAETWAFNTKKNVWVTRYSYIPEHIASLNNNLFTFKNGGMWLHDSNTLRNNFYGQQFTRSFDIFCNPKLGKNKRALNVHIKGDITTDLTNEDQVVVITTPEGQQSFIPAYEFYLDEGKYVAPVLKDINTPGMTGNQLPLRSGDDMVSSYFRVSIVNNRTDDGVCSQVNVVYKTEEFSV